MDGDMSASMQCFLLFSSAAVLLVSCGAALTDVLYRLPEEQPPNTLIISLAADQGLPDTGHLYQLEEGSPYLRVDEKTGDMYTTEIPIDRETLKDCRNLFDDNKCFLKFDVIITNMLTGMGSGPRLIKGQIEVLDINDNTPQFLSPVLLLSIPENTPIGDLFSIPMATDKDSGVNGVERYTLSTRDNFKQLFSLQVAMVLGEKVPQLVVIGNLDREAKESYDMNISVVDGGTPERQSSTLLRIIITDENDNAPKFERSPYEADLLENSPPGHSVLQVQAYDADTGLNGEIDYTIYQMSYTIQHLLQINRSTGIIYVRGKVDREERNFLKFFVVARDHGPNSLSSKVLVTVTIKDQNDNAPAIEIRGIGLITHHKGVVNISEDIPIGALVALVQVSDRDDGENAIVTCVVAGDAPFQLRPATESANYRKRKYFLQTTTLLDYERVKDYQIEIVAVDSGNPALSSTNSLKVQVIDINDNAPYVTKPANSSYTYLAPLTPPETRVKMVEAEDIDSGPNADLVFTITGGNPYKLFRISPTSGEITLEQKFTDKHNGLHRLVILVSDKGEPQRHTTALVHVFVNDTKSNVSLIKALVKHSLYTPLDRDIAGDPIYILAQHSNILYGSLAGIAGVILVIVAVVVIRYRLQKDTKSGSLAGKRENKDLYAPKQGPKNGKAKKTNNGKAPKPAKPLEEDEEASLQKGFKFNLIN